MRRPRDERRKGPLLPALDRIIDMKHALVLLAEQIDWGFLDGRFGSICSEGPGQPGLPTRLGRVVRDIRRKIDGEATLEGRFAPLLELAQRVRTRDQHQRGPKSLPPTRSRGYTPLAPEVECVGKGKAHAPCEFGCKVTIATPVTTPKGGQFVPHAKTLHGNPYDGHTLGPVVAEIEQLTGVETKCIHVDKGCRGHNTGICPTARRGGTG